MIDFAKDIVVGVVKTTLKNSPDGKICLAYKDTDKDGFKDLSVGVESSVLPGPVTIKLPIGEKAVHDLLDLIG